MVRMASVVDGDVAQVLAPKHPLSTENAEASTGPDQPRLANGLAGCDQATTVDRIGPP